MKILIPVDGSTCSEAAVREVAAQPWPEGVEARVLFALELYPRNLPGASVLPPEQYEELEGRERSRSKHFLEDAVALLERGGFRRENLTTVVDVGSPKRVIVEEAEAWGADLIVIGSHGDGALKRFLLGSVSHAVAMHAPCSVRIVRPKETA
jgi:nucleotide-binding universal stress UspA family protein